MKQIFISYSQDDKWMKDLLQEHLVNFGMKGFYRVWDDSQIRVGEYWEKAVQFSVNRADAAVLVITPNFLKSEYIREQELPPLLQLKREGQIDVFPVIFKACQWEKLPGLTSIQGFPKDGIPLMGRGLEAAKPILDDLAEIVSKSEKIYPAYKFKRGTKKEQEGFEPAADAYKFKRGLKDEQKGSHPLPEESPKESRDKPSAGSDQDSDFFHRYKVSGRLEDALKNQIESVEKLEKELDKEHPALAIAYNNAAAVSRALGRTQEAMEFQLKDLRISEKKLDPFHPDLAVSYNNLALNYKAMGRLKKAMEYQAKDLKISEKKLSKNDPDLATSFDNLSTIYQAFGRVNDALTYQEEALKIRKNVLDEKDPALATSYNNISSIYRAMGRLEDALDYQLKDIKISEEKLDRHHPDLGTAYNNLALIYFDMQEYKKAYKYGKQAVEILRKHFTSSHPKLAKAEKNLEIIRACL